LPICLGSARAGLTVFGDAPSGRRGLQPTRIQSLAPLDLTYVWRRRCNSFSKRFT
jgi:hypothetical protein